MPWGQFVTSRQACALGVAIGAIVMVLDCRGLSVSLVGALSVALRNVYIAVQGEEISRR
jgi:hypothetical protein